MKRVSPVQLFALFLSSVLCIALSACGSSKSSTASGSSSTASDSDTGIQKASLNDLLKGNKNAKCTFSSTDPTTNETTSGTIYVTGQRMRGDFTSKDSNGTQTASSMLRDNTYQYYWQSDTNSGYKMKLTTLDSTTTVTTVKSSTTTIKDETTTTGIGAQDNTQYDYNCAKWTLDESVLTPPSNVNFVDYSAQIQQGQQQESQIAQQACNEIQDATARAQCLSSVGQ